MTYCIVKDCQTNNSSKGTRAIRYSFPKDRNIKIQWCSILGIREDDLCGNWKVCALHFKEEDFKNPNVKRRILYSCAIPSQNLDQSQTTNAINNCAEPSIEIAIEQNYRETQEKPKIFKIVSPSDFKKNIPIQEKYGEKSKNLEIKIIPIQQNYEVKPKIVNIASGFKEIPIKTNNGEKTYNVPKILKISNGFTEIIPLQEDYGESIHDKPKILQTEKITNGFTEIIPLQENYGEITQDRLKILPTEKITNAKEIVPKNQNYGGSRCLFSLSLKEAKEEEIMSAEDVMYDEYKRKIILKNEVLRNALKKRERTISSLRKQLSRKSKKITKLETTINDFKINFEPKKLKNEAKCKSYCRGYCDSSPINDDFTI